MAQLTYKIDNGEISESYDIELKKTGTLYLKGKCPFKNCGQLAFVVSPQPKDFYCFRCHISGKIDDFTYL